MDLLSRAGKTGEEELVNLKLASIFLLTGYISDYYKPMEGAIRNVEEILPRHGFNQNNVDVTRKLIRNSFSDVIESSEDKILHDARYEYMGRVDYPALTRKLRKEIAEHGSLYDDKDWAEIQTRLLYKHIFITETARVLRNVEVETQVVTLYDMDQ
ncbi:MAG: hypothetical protein HZB98_01970 [Bacteroidia bacterium]|nr:hypothetical protein [Bacteroidia bacterium]